MHVGNPSARSGTPPVRPTLAGDTPLANMLTSLGVVNAADCDQGLFWSLWITCWLTKVPAGGCCVQDCLQPLSMQALPAQPESLCIVEMGGVEKQDELGEKGSIGFLYLNIGLQVLCLGDANAHAVAAVGS